MQKWTWQLFDPCHLDRAVRNRIQCPRTLPTELTRPQPQYQRKWGTSKWFFFFFFSESSKFNFHKWKSHDYLAFDWVNKEIDLEITFFSELFCFLLPRARKFLQERKVKIFISPCEVAIRNFRNLLLWSYQADKHPELLTSGPRFNPPCQRVTW